MKKLLVFCLIICSFFGVFGVPQEYLFADEEICQVVATNCYLYESPEFTVKMKDSSESNIVLVHGQKLSILTGGQESEDFIYVQVAFDQLYSGYVYKHYVTTNPIVQDTYPVFNAKVAVEDAIVYDLNKENLLTTLDKGVKLYLYEGYEKKEPFTAVCFAGEDGKLVYGFMKTTDLSPNGINAGVITGIMVIVSCVTIILLLVFMKKIKKKKKVA